MRHLDQVIALLAQQIGNKNEVDEIGQTAKRVSEKWVPPLSGGQEQTNGLIYGPVQSGKTGVLTATGAIGADEGYRTLLVLTSDIDPLYEQTLGRIREAFPGIDVIGRTEFKNRDEFLRRVKSGQTAIVTTKNASMLKTLVENFTAGNVKGLTCLIIDDEADQASLNTRERRADGSRSRINELIVALRGFFHKNTYLQVTATPQALFLRDASHEFRPKFTVLSYPGEDYVGGEDFFGESSALVREFPISDIATLVQGTQPTPREELPRSLVEALDVFVLGATYKRRNDATQNCAFLCHVSTKKADHEHIVKLLFRYKEQLTSLRGGGSSGVRDRLQAGYKGLARTHAGLRKPPFVDLLEDLAFLSQGTHIRLVNGDTDEDVAVKSPLNLFVGGNKLGRGVTIKNLLVSYYGRNPARPQADTVLQHARMYGYRRADIGLLRLFLPPELQGVFRAINKMETGLRSLIEESPTEEFRGVYVEGTLQPTRSNVLAPGSIGVYTGGGIYNPAQILRGPSARTLNAQLSRKVQAIADRTYDSVPLTDIRDLILLTQPDPSKSELVWNQRAIAETVVQWGKLSGATDAYVYVARGRGLKQDRRETQGILDSGEAGLVPDDRLTLFLIQNAANVVAEGEWWPQLRFPKGRYGFAFSI